MKIIRGLHQIAKSDFKRIVAIGNLDGMHLGHQALIERLEQIINKTDYRALVMLFEPQPEEYFKQSKCPARLMRLREKLNFIKNHHSIDEVLIVHFNKQMAEKTGSEFLKKVLINQLNMKKIIVGEDFCFGKNHEGNVEFLKQMQNQHDFSLEIVKSVYEQINNQRRRISSSWIRELLSNGDLINAERLLGHQFSYCGRVIHGDHRARQLNFPTANVYLHRQKSPIQGVFIVNVLGADKNACWGVANVGFRPTVNGSCLLMEVHLFDFNQDIYGRDLEVIFIHKLRDEKKFETLSQLQEQVQCDIEKAKAFIAFFGDRL